MHAQRNNDKHADSEQLQSIWRLAKKKVRNGSHQEQQAEHRPEDLQSQPLLLAQNAVQPIGIHISQQAEQQETAGILRV